MTAVTYDDGEEGTPKGNKKLNESIIREALDWAYDQAIQGIPFTQSATELAEDYVRRGGTIEHNADSLIRWQVTKCATTGFLTGLGGLLMLPVQLPANITVNFYVQLRMVAAIAHMGGYDVKSDHVRSLCYVCLTGSAASDALKEFGIKLGAKMTEQMLKKLSGEVIVKINQKVGFRLLTKFGEKGIVNLVKLVPILGGFIGAAFDGPATYIIGKTAKTVFLSK